MKRVEKELEKNADEASAMLEAWKNGYTEMEFRLMNGEDLLDENMNRNRISHHCPKHALWKRKIIAHEQQFQNLDDGGMPNESLIGLARNGGRTDWTILSLAHKPSGNFYSRNLVLYSNGLMSSGHYYGDNTSGSSSGAWLPYWQERDSDYPPMYVEDYETHITEYYQEAMNWIDEKFEGKPKVRKRMIDSLDEQMDHDKFRGLHWRN